MTQYKLDYKTLKKGLEPIILQSFLNYLKTNFSDKENLNNVELLPNEKIMYQKTNDPNFYHLKNNLLQQALHQFYLDDNQMINPNYLLSQSSIISIWDDDIFNLNTPNGVMMQKFLEFYDLPTGLLQKQKRVNDVLKERNFKFYTIYLSYQKDKVMQRYSQFRKNKIIKFQHLKEDGTLDIKRTLDFYKDNIKEFKSDPKLLQDLEDLLVYDNPSYIQYKQFEKILINEDKQELILELIKDALNEDSNERKQSKLESIFKQHYDVFKNNAKLRSYLDVAFSINLNEPKSIDYDDLEE